MVVLMVACSILFIICVVKWMTRDRTLYNFADSIPGPKAYPVIGSSHKFIIMKQNEEGESVVAKDVWFALFLIIFYFILFFQFCLHREI
jgi:hypothetical protein